MQRIAAETKTKGGILLPEKAQNKTLEAMVVAVGPGMRNEAGTSIPMAVEVGDKVLLPEFGGAKVSGSWSYYIILGLLTLSKFFYILLENSGIIAQSLMHRF